MYEEKEQIVAELQKELAELKESTLGLDTLAHARFKVWSNIWTVIENGWKHMLRYQELLEQVISANQKLKQLDHEMENKEEMAREALIALEHLSDKELALLGIDNRIT